MAKHRAERIREHFTDYSVYEFLASVANNGRKILILSLLLASATFVVSVMFVSREYRTTASLLVTVPPYKQAEQPSQVQLDVPADPLSPKAYQEILRSPYLIKQVLAALKGQLSEDVILEDFMQRLSVGLVTQKERLTTVFTPLIELHVRGPDPEECQLIANTWADLATSASLRIKNSELIRFNRLIREQYDIQATRMNRIENDMQKFERESDLAGKEALLEHLGKSNAESLKDLVAVQVEYTTARGQQEALEKAAEAYYVKGKWVGSLEPLGVTEKDIDPSALEMFRARKHLLELEQRRADFKVSSQILANEKLHENLTKELGAMQNRLDQTLDDLALEAQRSETLKKLLAEDSPVLVVRKAMTDDAIWRSVAEQGKIPDALKGKALTEEAVNEAWLALREEYGRATAAAHGKKAASESGRAQLARLRKDLDALDAKLARDQEELAALDVAMEAASNHYKKVYEYYTEVAVELSRARDMTRRYEKQLADLKLQFDDNRNQLFQIGQDVGAGLVKRAQFERTIEAQKTLYEEISRKNARAYMADLEKTGDLRVAFYAPEPEKSFARQKQRSFTGAVFTLSLIAFSIFFAARDRMRGVAA